MSTPRIPASARPLSTLAATLALAAAAFAGCHSERAMAPGGGAPGNPCGEGEHRCVGRDWQVCGSGAFTTAMTCPADQFCSDAVGCTPCRAGHSACSGNLIVACDASGQPTTTQTMDCAPLTCALDPESGDGACVAPCDPRALARSYTGCVYYAADLPQWGQSAGVGIGSIAADQQFAVTVANPWPVTIDVLVEQNDAAVGTPPRIRETMKAQVKPRSVTTLALPQREVSGFINGQRRSRSLRTARAYRVTTSRPASLYQFNPQNNPGSYSNDASLLIPVNALDASYVVLGWPGRGGDVSALGLVIKADNRSFVTVVAARDNTKVRVTPSTEVMAGDNVPAIHAGKSYSITLNEMEALNLEGADFAVGGATDFTGTRIEADGPLAVWSGVECITINPRNAMETCCCDHLEEQLFPRSSLGLDYVVVRSEGRNLMAPDPEFFRILALSPGTQVTTSLPPPDDRFTLGAGQMHEMLVYDDFTVHASSAVTIGQYQVSQDSSLAGNGDPSFELVPPVVQHRPEYIFLVPSGYGESYMLVALPTGAELMLDGGKADCRRSTIGPLMTGVSYDALRCPVATGQHRVWSPSRFGLVIEGWGPGPVSYGYTGGMEFRKVNDDCDEDFDCPTAEFCAGGVCVPEIIVQ